MYIMYLWLPSLPVKSSVRMEWLVEFLQDVSVWSVAKTILILLALIPNGTLTIKILVRPSIRTIFNISLAIFFGIIAIFGPLLFFFYIEVFQQHYSADIPAMHGRAADCARTIEFRNAIGESLRIISVNLLFRFFYVVYADKGLSVRGQSNTTVLKWIYVAFTLGKLYFLTLQP